MGAQRLSDDGKYLLDDNGNKWDARTHHFISGPGGGAEKRSVPSGPPTVVGSSRAYRKGDPMPKQSESGASFGDDMRKWRQAQREETPAPVPSPRATAVKKMLSDKID